MKLLIIAGPYEADRIRKSAVAAGFETVAVEPGESLSGWITASRPQLIVMAPQMVNADPALALAKVRSVPRGRVPIFLVGDEADEPRMASLSEGFFVRPVSPEALLEHAKVVLATERAREATNLGHEFSRGGRTPGNGPRPTLASGQPAPGSARAAMGLRPLVAAVAAAAPSTAAAQAGTDTGRLLAALDAGIDAFLDAELSSAVASTPRFIEPEAEFSAQPTADMKTGDLRKGRPADEPTDANGAVAAQARVAVATRAVATRAVEEEARAGANGASAAQASETGAVATTVDAAEAETGAVATTVDAAEAETGAAATTAAAAGTETGAAASPPRPADAVRVADDGRARILSRYALVEVGDYFQVLGVGRDVTPVELERAHARIAQELAPGRLDPGVAGELGAQIEAIRAVAEEALRVLGDARLRARYSARI